MATATLETTVGELVVDRPSRARIFQKLGIDFCCGGKKPLAEVCRAHGLDPAEVLASLEAADVHAGDVEPARMSLSELCDHIESTHHAYLREELPRLSQMIDKVARVHGDRHPWMVQVAEVFGPFQADMIQHMNKEDHVLFPAIRQLALDPQVAQQRGLNIAMPISVMEHEHDDAGAALARMRELTHGFTPPPGACNTFLATLDGLRELEADMHQHVHKENNILFPRALAAQGHSRGPATSSNCGHGACRA